MKTSNSQKNLKLRGELKAMLTAKKKDQEYAMNKMYKQFETTYHKDFRDISSPQKVGQDQQELFRSSNNKQMKTISQSQSMLNLKLDAEAQLMNGKSQGLSTNNAALLEYLKAKRQGNHRNIKTFQQNRVKHQLADLQGGKQSNKREQHKDNQGKVENTQKVIEEYFSKTMTSPLRKNQSTLDNPDIQSLKQSSLQNDKAYSVTEVKSHKSFTKSASDIDLLRKTFPKKHLYLVDHLDHMKNCPELVCVCCSTKTGDHFVSFKYPQQIGSVYEKQHTKEVAEKGKRAPMFILDNEKSFGTKVQSGQQYVSTQRNDFKQFAIKPTFFGEKKFKDQDVLDENGNKIQPLPFVANSSYRTNFIDATVPGMYHEKHPIFPVYSLPFKDKSSYQKSFSALQSPMKEQKEYDKILVADLTKRAKEGRVLYQDMPFQSSTTNRLTFLNQKPYDKAELCPPPEVPVKSFQIPNHFLSLQRKDFDGKYKPHCEVNEIKQKMVQGTVTCKHSFKLHL